MRDDKQIEKIYMDWINKVKEEDFQTELKNMNTKRKKEAFVEDIAFGTGGLRGILGVGSAKMNELTIKKVTQGFINYLNKTDSNPNKKVAISRDPRHKSLDFVNLIISLFIKSGIEVVLYDDIKPTPMLSYLVRHEKCSGGIMITASHNPKEYNGYKVYNKEGAQLNLEESEKMIEEVNKVDYDFDFQKTEVSDISISDNPLVKYVGEEFDSIYFNDIKDVIKNKEEQKDVNIVYSPLHGTGYKVMPKAFKEFGFVNVNVVEEQSTPDPDFSYTKSTNPEEFASYELALKYALKYDSDLIIQNDPDADRLGIIYKNKSGEYIFQTGNETGTLLIDYLIKRDNITSGSLVKTVVTGELGGIIARDNGIKVFDTLTGFKFIADVIAKKASDGFMFGYEESYGYLIKDCVRDKDAIQSSLLIAEMVDYYKKQNLDLGEVLDTIYKKYGYYYEITNSIVLKGFEGMEKIKNVMEYYKTENISNFLDYKVTKKIDFNDGYEDIPRSDVVKFYLDDLGWVVLRPSGTEPKLKVYFSTKSTSIEKSKEITETIYNSILNKMENL